MLNEKQLEVIRELKNEGYAVAIFTPAELEDVEPMDVEDAMISKGWDTIDSLREEEDE
jgi:hypothetical protein